MQIFATADKKWVELQLTAMKELEEECKAHVFFELKEPDEVYVYCFASDEFRRVNEERRVIVAIARYGNIFAMKTPDYVTDENLSIFNEVLNDLDRKSEVVLFTEKDYEAVIRYNSKKRAKKICLV